MHGTKILSMIVENLYFLDSLNFLPMSVKSMPKSFDLTSKKGYYPYFFNTADNLDYVGPYPEPKFCGETTCQSRSEHNFWNDMKRKRQNVLQ